MRLWSLHPRYLDAKGLVALWREALLAQKVLQGATRGYRNHPQLHRFKPLADPAGALALYLEAVCDEAGRRGYNFDRARIGPRADARIVVTDGQLQYELGHLRAKLLKRDPAAHVRIVDLLAPDTHPMFDVVAGPVAEWEVV